MFGVHPVTRVASGYPPSQAALRRRSQQRSGQVPTRSRRPHVDEADVRQVFCCLPLCLRVLAPAVVPAHWPQDPRRLMMLSSAFSKDPFGNNLHIWLAGCGRAAALQMLAMPMGIAALCALHRISQPAAKCTTYPRTGPNLTEFTN